jgi:methionine sulfoxide reductase catalytic subunit
MNLRHPTRMANIIIRPSWHLPESRVTAERFFLNRRKFLRQLGVAGAGAMSLSAIGCREGTAADAAPANAPKTPAAITPSKGFPAPRHPDFNPDWKLSEEEVTATYNNFYEFTLQKDVHRYVGNFQTDPWEIEITGLCDHPMKVSPQELVAEFGLEERVYRFRCVEAWAMIVPWTGFQFSKLIEKAKPKPAAKFIRMLTANKPEEMPGVKRVPDYPWPYFEGLRLDEAMNPLTLVATGIYGKPMAKQYGAPIRLVVPWKYGYKSIKSIVKIEFTDRQPKTFWETLQPQEYPFESNVDPRVPHPRWSQATHRMIDTNARERTLPLNGYAEHVGHLYRRG